MKQAQLTDLALNKTFLVKVGEKYIEKTIRAKLPKETEDEYNDYRFYWKQRVRAGEVFVMG